MSQETLDQLNLPPALCRSLLADDLERDLVTARRALLLSILWREARLSGDGLMARVRAALGRDCFGKAARATFQRDLRALRAILASAGCELKYSRRPGMGGYYVLGRPPLDDELAAQLRAAMAEVDPRQLEIVRGLSPAARVRQAARLSDGLRRMDVQRRLRQHPAEPIASAYQEVMRRYDALGG